MWENFIRKILAILMPLVLSINGISFTLESQNIHISYDFANDRPGSAEGTITVEAPLGGKYDIYWGDDDNTKLSVEVDNHDIYYGKLAEVTVKKGEGSTEISSFAAIPDDAETVLVYRGGICRAHYDIEDEKQPSDNLIYNFGALSDVHFNRYKFPVKDNSVLTFTNALNFLDMFDIQLVGMSGDVSRKDEEDSFIKFNRIAAEHDYPVYTCLGNHDSRETYDKNHWYDYMNVGVYSDEKADGVQSVVRDTLDFVYAPENVNGDVFIFLSQVASDYTADGYNVTPEQLDWLGEQLEMYKDRTVYLFYHSFLPSDDGVVGTCVGNIMGPHGETYGAEGTLGRYDDVKLKEYMAKYKNVVFFTGHSHFAFEMQKYNPNLNIGQYKDGAVMVHIPSVSSTRVIGIKEGKRGLIDQNTLNGSQGYLVSVYEDRIVLTGIDFTEGKFIADATYCINK